VSKSSWRRSYGRIRARREVSRCGLCLGEAARGEGDRGNGNGALTALVSGDVGIAFPVDEYEKSSSENAAHILASVSELARKADIECATVHAKDQYPAEGILETARTNNCDLIVMASHGRRGLGRLLLGSQAVKVLTHSTVPALITGSVGRTAMYKHLLIATDGSSASAKAISDRIVLAKAVVTQTTVVMVTKPWGEAA
jgi:nucleotide-binding universal stress UspA family protein